MKRPNAVGFCPRCAEPVAVCCPTPNHGLHFLLSAISLGAWLPIWLVVAIHSRTCRCLQCGCRFARSNAEPVMPVFFETDRSEGAHLSPAAALHGLLISKNLVYYMPTAAIRR